MQNYDQFRATLFFYQENYLLFQETKFYLPFTTSLNCIHYSTSKRYFELLVTIIIDIRQLLHTYQSFATLL